MVLTAEPGFDCLAAGWYWQCGFQHEALCRGIGQILEAGVRRNDQAPFPTAATRMKARKGADLVTLVAVVVNLEQALRVVAQHARPGRKIALHELMEVGGEG
jgi:hypothetical protein